MNELIFSKKTNFSENFKPVRKNKRIIVSSEVAKDSLPPLDILPDGEYDARWYGYTLELTNGDKYKTKTGVRNKRQVSKIKKYLVKNGDVTEVKSYSGLGEVGAGMQGMSYGMKATFDPNPTRVSIDQEGFKIPNKVVQKFKVDTNKPSNKVKKFSADGRFTGLGNSQPSITIDKDNAIIRNRTNGGTQTAAQSSQGTSVTYNPKKPFNLSVEPWVVSPVMTDTADGIYVGKLLGDKITAGSNNIMLGVKLNKQIPEDIVAFLKDSKAYVFKISQLAYQSSIKTTVFSETGKCPADGCIQKDGDKWMIISNKTGAPWKPRYESKEKAEKALAAYHANKHFSEITTDDQFREYAHKLMQSAHKDNYDPKKTDKVVDGLLDKHQGSDYGELIGRLKSGLGNKSFADPAITPANPAAPSQGVQPSQSRTPGGTVNANPPQAQVPPTNPNQPDPNQAQAGDPGQGQMPNPPVMVDGSKYGFEYSVSSELDYSMEHVIGNLLYSIAFVHLFHLCTKDYVDHKSLNQYYEEMPKCVDALAEAYLANVEDGVFKLSIVPTNGSPIEYLEKLKEFIIAYKTQKSSDDRFTQYSSYFDRIIECISATLYPMKRLTEGKKAFSIVEDRAFGFKWKNGKSSYRFGKDEVNTIRDSITDVLIANQKKNKRTIPELKGANGRQIRQYVQNHTLDESSTTDLIKATMNALADTAKQFIPD